MAEKQKKNQQTEVLKWLRTHKSLSSLESFNEFGITRLSRVISDLRRKGYGIQTNREAKVNRYGDTCSFAHYVLVYDKDKENN